MTQEFPGAAPQVSVLIPAYNASQHIAGAVNSALQQDGVAVEVIVVDDGSTDDTLAVLEPFHHRIHVLRQKNSGQAIARDRAAQMAKGQWLAFLDADDEWQPNKLLQQLSLANGEADLVYTERLNVDRGDRITALQSAAQTLWEGDIFEQLLLGNFITLSSALICKTRFDELGGFGDAPLGCEDWDLWLRHSARGGQVKVCRQPLTWYRWSQSSVSGNHDRMCAARLKVLERALHLPRAKSVPRSVIRKAFANVWQTSAWHVAPFNRLKALRWYLHAAAVYPWNPAVYKAMLKCCLMPGAT
jgi:glycosyltransferase involved in cell wall biosynthesis